MLAIKPLSIIEEHPLVCFRVLVEKSIDLDSKLPELTEIIPANDMKPQSNRNKYSCVRTTFNNSVLMKNTCLPLWKGEIAHKCEFDAIAYETEENLMKIPATNTRTNITYRNIYCAICNLQDNIELWNFNFICREHESLTSDTHFFTDKNVAQVLETWNSAAPDAELFSVCDIEPMLQSNLEPHVQSCNPDIDNVLDNVNNHYRIKNINSSDFLIPRSNICDEVTQTSLYNTFCRNCTTDTFYELDTDFVYIDSEMVFICDDEQYLLKPDWREINNTYIHVCGEPIFQQIHSFPQEESYFGFQTYLMRQGEILIIAFLATFFYKDMKDLPKKILFSQALMLFGARVAYELDSLVPIQYLHYLLVMYHYFILTLNCWMAISCYNVWFVICRLTNKFQRDDEMSQTKRYLFYFLICNIFIPIPIIGTSVFLYFSPINETSCMLKINYKKRGAHLLEKPVPYFVFHTLPVAILHITGMTLFVHTCYFIRNLKNNGVISSPQTCNYVVLLKLSKYVIMGTLNFFVVTFIDLAFRLTKDPAFFVMRWCIIKSYGTLIFILFIFPWDYIGGLFFKYKERWLGNTSSYAGSLNHRCSVTSSTFLE